MDVNKTKSVLSAQNDSKLIDELQKPASSPKLTDDDIAEASNVMRFKGTLKELFSVKVYRNNLLIMVIVWSFSSFAFFLVPLYIGNEELNLFMISLCLSTAELISAALCIYITHGRDKIKALTIFCALCTIGCIGTLILQYVSSPDDQIA